jgi:dipeptidyl aminopeptidase/acylaminoacyl peptidase
LTQLSDQKILAPDRLQEAVSPNGRLVAFISSDKDGLHHLELNLLFLPEGKIEVITELTNASTEPAQDASMPDEKIEPVRAIIEQKSLAWSPDGKTLAFIGVQDGPSADLYSYSLDNKKITRLSDGPSQAYAVSWSPDGKYILNFGAEGFGTGAGFNGLGGWATTADGSKIITLFKGGNTPEFIGWVDNQNFLMQNWTPVCGATNLRLVDVEKQTFTELVKGCFSSAAVSANGMILTVGDQNTELQGIYAFGPDNIERKQLSSESAGYIQYLPEDGSFVVYKNDQIVVYSNTGRLVAESPPASCKYGFGIHGFGALYAWTCAVGDTGVWANGMGVPISQLTSEAGWGPFWSPTNTLYFFSEAGLNRAPFPNFSPQPVAQIEGEEPQMAWVR